MCLECDATADQGAWTYMEDKSCNDGDLCTHTDVCVVGGVGDPDCAGTTYSCDDPFTCTDDSCMGDGTCANDVQSDKCLINGTCYADGDESGMCLECDATADQGAWTYIDDKVCDDQDLCTHTDVCVAGGTGDQDCAGTTYSCDDQKTCTDDSCDGDGTCTNAVQTDKCLIIDTCYADGDESGMCLECEPVSDQNDWTYIDDKPCDDNDMCTDPDTCAAGGAGDGDCEGPAVVCDDKDACNGVESCDSWLGCQPGTPPVCNDHNPCTIDTCDADVGCEYQTDPDCIPCVNDPDCTGYDDGNLCNGTLACYDESGAACAGCADGACLPDPDSIIECTENPDPCLTTVCVPDTGACVDQDELYGTPCSDEDACTENDACNDGSCSGSSILCDDNDVCTDDSCDTSLGCQYSNNTAACDDGDNCTLDDACLNGVCAGTPDPLCQCIEDVDCDQFEDGDLCNGTLICVGTQCEVDPATVVTCPEPPQCREAVCLPDVGVCTEQYLVNGSACDDDDACTDGETCTDGECSGGDTVQCVDQDICTDDSCDPLYGCVFNYNNAPCDDGNACTESDRCVQGVCQGSPIPGCECSVDSDCAQHEDGDICNGVLICVEQVCVIDSSSIITCPEPAPDSCETIHCEASTGNCIHTDVPDGRPCDDGDPCTTPDECSNGICSGPPECSDSGDCNDADVCTDDTCEASGCCSWAFNNAACDDGNDCTENDTCNEGVCAGTNTCTGNCDPVLEASCGFSDVWSIFYPGSTDNVDQYDCASGTFWGFGPEYAYTFTAPYNAWLTLTIVSGEEDEDTAILLLTDTGAGCNGGNCIDYSYTELVTTIVEGQDYYLVVDGEDPYDGGYSLYVDCAPLNEYDCGDGIDEDNDDMTDCEDTLDCAYTPECPVPHCQPAWTIYCGYPDYWWTYGDGHTELIDTYDCTSGTYDGYGGPEYTYQFFAPVDGEYTVTLSNFMGALEVFVVEATQDWACLPENCVDGGDSTVTFTGVAGQTYYLVVDGPIGSGSYYTIDITCPCIPDCESWWDCGDDGCGGICGAGCTGDEVCIDGACYPPICPCDPETGDPVCGSDEIDYANDICAACAICEEEAPWCIGCSGDKDCDQTDPLDPVNGYISQLAPCGECVCDNAYECEYVLPLPPPCEDQDLCSDQYITYDTPCEMKTAYDCSETYSDHVFTPGACICPACSGEPPDPKVCGDDDVTYPDMCTLQTCPINAGALFAHYGACLNEWFCPECAGEPIDEVCGADGVTYANTCAATTPECGNTTVASPGICP